MAYIYDILLNFNKELIEFFEWEENDKIKYIKKIALFKIKKPILKDIINNEITLENNFLDKVSSYEINGLESYKSCLLTDGEMGLGILIKNNKIISYSRLLLDEENEILEVSEKLDYTNINYKIIKPKNNKINNLTRKEQIMKNKLNTILDDLYNKEEREKLYYLYYEYTNKESKNINYIYTHLKQSLKAFNNKHKYLLAILESVKKI